MKKVYSHSLFLAVQEKNDRREYAQSQEVKQIVEKIERNATREIGAGCIYNHETHNAHSHKRLIDEERIQQLSYNIARIIKHKSDGTYSA